MLDRPVLTLGVEEEYFLVDKETCRLVHTPPEGMLDMCNARLSDQVSPEFIRGQLEIGTRVCGDISEVREELIWLRQGVAEVCGEFGIAPIAASTHPFAHWREQQHTPQERYLQLAQDLQAVARRMLIGGMHIHVGIEDEGMRIDLMNQFSYFLPHLLALSCSSPFWRGHKTGLDCYRLTVFNDLPRTGLPSYFHSFGEYRRHADVLINAGIIEDTTKLWWDIRPSGRYPTLEVRIMDVCTNMEHAISITAMAQALFLTLHRLKQHNIRWRQYRKMLIDENRWRAMRYGVRGSLIDFGRGEMVDYPQLLEELLMLVGDAADELGCKNEVLACRDIVANGNSANRQVAVYQEALDQGAEDIEALREVVRWLVKETVSTQDVAC